jgi:hypothetical protein
MQKKKAQNKHITHKSLANKTLFRQNQASKTPVPARETLFFFKYQKETFGLYFLLHQICSFAY